MALTKPSFNNINSNTLARLNDPLVVINAANTSPNNQDIGFIFNRGSSGNVAFSWNETIDSFVLINTTSTGQIDGNLVITGNSNLRLGNLTTVGASSFTGNMTTGHILPAANVTYDLGSPTNRFRTLYIAGNTIDMGGATISANATSIILTNPSGGTFAVSGSSSALSGASLTTTGDATIGGNLIVNGTTVTVNATTVTTNDKNIVVANNQSTSSGIDGAGIDAGGGTPIATWRFNNSTSSWQSNVAITPAANNSVALGGASNWWSKAYATNIYGTLQTASQTNITSVGTLTGLTLSGTLTGTTVNAATIGNTGTSLVGTISTAAQTNITSLGTLTSLTLSGTLTGTTVNAATIGNSSATLIGTTANISGNASVVGNLTVGNLLATGYFYANGAAFAGGGSGTPGGSNGQIQYNNNGLFGGAAGLTTNGSNLTAIAGIQNTPIGNTTANTGAFTTLSATGTFTGTTINAAIIGNTGSTLTGTIQTAAQTNITSVGTLTGLTLSGSLTGTTINAATIGNTGAAFTGASISAATIGNVGATHTGATVNAATIGNAGATLTGATVNAATIGNTSAAHIGATLVVTSTIDAGGAIAGSRFVSNVATGTAPLTVSSTTTVTNLSADLWDGNHFGSYLNQAVLTTSSPTFVAVSAATIGNSGATLVGTTANISGNATLSGNVMHGNVFATGYFYANGTVFSSSPAGSNTQLQYNNNGVFGGAAGLTTNGTNLTVTAGLQNTPIGNATANTGAFTTLTATTSITRNSRNVPTYVASASAPTSPLQGDFWYETGTDILHQYINDGTSSTWVDISSALVNSATTATANTLALRDASADLYATVFRGKATSAQYADLAENYAADADYSPGTVVVFGGPKEITISQRDHDSRVAGVISTNPAYLMNSDFEGLPVAFTGRVPCKVQGPVRKGDVLVTSDTPGVAQTINKDKYVPGCVIGKALEDYNDFNIATIEVVVGRF